MRLLKELAGSASYAVQHTTYKSITAFRADRKRLEAALKKADVLAPIPHANHQSLASKTILLIDHNAYHVGQLILLRQLLHNWPGN